MDQFIKANQELWDQKTPYHKQSEFYKMPAFLGGQTSLQEIELEALAERVSGKKMLHLQCHFGQDSLSWARLGAEVTGVDLSGESIKLAHELNDQLGLNARFIQSNILDLKGKIDEQFDIVFTSYGTTIWLPELKSWAATIQHYLKPGGLFYIVDFHPAFYCFDHASNHLKYDYFHSPEPYIEEAEGSYADKKAALNGKECFWSHSFQEILSPLLKEGLQLRQFQEFPFSPYNAFEHMKEIEKGRYVYQGTECKFPHIFSMEMSKNG